MGTVKYMTGHEFSKEELEKIKTHFPKLELIKPGIWKGIIDFDRIHRDYRIADSYEIGIGVDVGFPETFPIVHELGGRTEKTAKKYNANILDLHYNPMAGACLCVVQERTTRLPLGSDFIFFIENLVIPYFYGLSYFNEQGRWPWKEYGHGGIGILEHYAETWKSTDKEIIKSIIPTFLSDKNWKKYRKQFINPRPKQLCICGSHKAFSECHPSAWKGVMLISQDFKNLKINLYKLLTKK